MRGKNLAAMVVTAGLFITGVLAQHEGHQQGQASTPADQGGKMMCGNMASDMSKMAMGQDATARIADQLQKSFAAIQAEQDPAALKEKLAAHGALLKELQDSLQAKSHSMCGMQESKNDSPGGCCAAMKGEAKK